MYLIIDVEATCWQRGHPLYGQNEIIEVGAILLGDGCGVLGEVQQFVKPVRHPILSEFCTKLTSITQSDVDTAPRFSDALANLQTQVEEMSGCRLSELVFCSWGDYDRKQFVKDCHSHQIAYPFGGHRNVKAEFARSHRIRPVGVVQALRILGFRFDGTHHRGIDDARNIAKIFRRLMTVDET